MASSIVFIPGAIRRVLVVTEVGLSRPRCDDQAVVGVVATLARNGGGVDHPRLEVESGDLGQDHLDVLVAPQHVPEHGRDVTRAT